MYVISQLVNSLDGSTLNLNLKFSNGLPSCWDILNIVKIILSLKMEQAGTNCIMSFSCLFEIKVLQIYTSVPLS